MIIDAVFQYEASVILGRKRNPETRSFSGRVSVEVREAGLADLPVAFRWDRDEHRAPAGPHEVLWDGERLWEDLHTYDPARGFGMPGTAGTRDAAWLATRADYRTQGCNQGGDNLDPLMVAPTRHQGAFPFIEDDVRVRRVMSTEFDLRAGQVSAAATRLMVAEGRLLARALEPVFLLGHDAIVVCQPRNPSASVHWRADEVGAMQAVGVPPGLEVLIPEAVRSPLPEMALRDAATLALHDLAPEHDAVAEELRTAARDLSRAIDAGEGETDGARLAVLLSESLPLLNGRAAGMRGTAAARIELALARFDARAFASATPPFA